ncbi:MAG: hypothetical protein E4H08_08780 [Candidatus Atribacteria bacterium]|jgi:hypothetical protein|nr:MAG: hypothetical protein E4H08_08780 [Candidatus Atribacteria bacterium]
MNRRNALWMIGLLLIGTFGLLVAAQEGDVQTEPLVFGQPVLITSIGQSAGAAQARVVAIKAGIEATYSQRATIEELEGFATLIIVLGASSKGLGAAGVDVDGEITWATELLAKASELGIQIIAMHIEGSARRGPSSDLINSTFARMAATLIVKGTAPGVEWTADESADGNADGLFTTIATENEIPIMYIDTTLGAVDMFIELFGMTPAEG